ncbi:MAG TPA: SRPBCC family protein [Mycobacterium sp.]|nr:SRPBCC family protein [Mycobacterium sp.]
MAHAERTITISAPPSEVFAFFTTPSNDQRWRAGVKDIKAEGGPRVGAVVHQTIAGPMGRGVKADIMITAYEPNTRYAFRAVEGPVRPVGSYVFTQVEGGTAVTFALSAEVAGLKKLMMGGPVQKSMEGEMAALDTAKKVLEGSG